MLTNAMRGFFAGSGIGAFSDPAVIDRLLALVAANKKMDSSSGPVRVAYVGTATYDLPEPMAAQTALLRARGCEVLAVSVADPDVAALSPEDDAFVRTAADVVLVSGGNTLFAVRRWEETGLAAAMHAAAADVSRRPVMAGGSAGAICWFTAGHSDSADPSTYALPMLKAAMGEPLSAEEQNTTWSYLRVHGLDLLPGLVCPHYDQTQSNGLRREADFANMMRRHPTERGIGIDHWAVLILTGDGAYEVFAVPGKARVAAEGEVGGDDTTPSVYTLDMVDGGELAVRRAASAGRAADLLREAKGPVVGDPFERFCAMQNPTKSSGALLRR